MTTPVDLNRVDGALARGDVVAPEVWQKIAPIRPQAAVILDAVLHGRPDIAASIISDGIAFYSATKPVKADTVAEYMNDVQTPAKRQNGAKKGKQAAAPKARKPRASKAKKTPEGVSV